MSILHVVGQCVVLNREGSIFAGLCPLHDDKNTKSLKVYPDTDSWYCFGCNRHGDDIQWVREYLKLSYHEALEWLGKIEKVPLLEIKPTKKQYPSIVRSLSSELIDYWHSYMEVCDKRQWFYDRGFCDSMIDKERWGWDGERMTIPVWDGEKCIGVRRRKINPSVTEEKYIGIQGFNRATVWGRNHCQQEGLPLFCFFGELDAALANQDGFPAWSPVNGAMAFMSFPDNWPDKWFPNSKELYVVPDKGEEFYGAKLAGVWNDVKGFMSAKLVHWPVSLESKDYCEFRKNNGAEDFINIINQTNGG